MHHKSNRKKHIDKQNKYVLFIEKNVQDEQQKKRLYEYLESYIMRRLVTR